MWDLQKTLNNVRGIARRAAQGKPPLTSSPEERAYFDRRKELSARGHSKEEIDSRTILLRDIAYPEGDWPGHNSKITGL
jgi:hypothetical protein